MTDIDPDDVAPPITVSSTPLQAQTGAGVRSALIVLGALPTIITVLGKHDTMALVNYLGSADFAPVAALMLPFAIGWGQWIARRLHAERAAMAKELPDSVAVVK